jgi:hypothetical protein
LVVSSRAPVEEPLLQVGKEISLADAEETLIRGLVDGLGDEVPIVVDVAQALRRTRALLSLTTELNLDGNGLSLGQLGVIGLVRRTHELLRAALDSAIAGNLFGWSASFRGVIETIGAAAWVAESPARVVELVRQQNVSPGKLVDAAARVFPGLKDDYARLSSWVHPTPASYFLGLAIIDEEDRRVVIAVPSPPPRREQLYEMTRLVVGSAEVVHRIVGWVLRNHSREVLSGSGATVTMKGGRPAPPRAET